MIKNLKTYGDFKKVFNIFEKAPFWEKWSEEEYYEEYCNFINNGEMYGYYDIDDIYGLITILYGMQKKCPITFEVPEKVIYLSDVAVLEDKRQLGIGNSLMKYLINNLEERNKYDQLYLRTNLVGSMIEGTALRNGFEIMRDTNNQIITQTVTFDRTRDDISKEDTRKFMIKTLKRR